MQQNNAKVKVSTKAIENISYEVKESLTCDTEQNKNFLEEDQEMEYKEDYSQSKESNCVHFGPAENKAMVSKDSDKDGVVEDVNEELKSLASNNSMLEVQLLFRAR